MDQEGVSVKRVKMTRIDLNTASREELMAEVLRLNEVIDNWASSWQAIVQANTNVWADMVNDLQAKVRAVQDLWNGWQDDFNDKPPAQDEMLVALAKVLVPFI